MIYYEKVSLQKGGIHFMNRHGKSRRNKWIGAALCAVVALAAIAGCTGAKGQSSALAKAVSSALQANTGAPVSSSSSGKVRCYFPRDGQKAAPELISIINSSKKTLDLAIYSFTDPQIASAVRGAKERGVAVRLITDREQSASQSQKSVLSGLKKAGIPIKLNTHQGIMHLKVTIADGAVATTGSFNYTKSAETKNDEVFVVLDDPKTASGFEAEFNRMWNDASNFKKY